MDKLYLTIPEAAEYVGIGVNLMRDLMNSKDAPAYLLVGDKKRVRREALEEYFKRKEIR